MTVLVATVAFVFACALVAVLRPTRQRHSCRPGEHLVSVVAARRLRHAVGTRYWIRCLLCDVELGPYESWHVAWADVFRTRMETPRDVGRPGQSRVPSNEVSR